MQLVFMLQFNYEMSVHVFPSLQAAFLETQLAQHTAQLSSSSKGHSRDSLANPSQAAWDALAALLTTLPGSSRRSTGTSDGDATAPTADQQGQGQGQMQAQGQGQLFNGSQGLSAALQPQAADAQGVGAVVGSEPGTYEALLQEATSRLATLAEQNRAAFKVGSYGVLCESTVRRKVQLWWGICSVLSLSLREEAHALLYHPSHSPHAGSACLLPMFILLCL